MHTEEALLCSQSGKVLSLFFSHQTSLPVPTPSAAFDVFPPDLGLGAGGKTVRIRPDLLSTHGVMRLIV